jgi:hypothetical protein
VKLKAAYLFWLSIQRDLPKVERIGIGQKIDRSFLDVLELTFTSSYLPVEPKIVSLSRTVSRLDVLKFFLQLAWEGRIIPTGKHSELSQKLEEVGRMLGGWKKGLEEKLKTEKTPFVKTGEKQ